MPKPATSIITTSLLVVGITLPKHISESLASSNYFGDLHNDSREIGQGDIFCAIIGHQQDGRQYIEKAIDLGAKLVLTECENKAEHGMIRFSEHDDIAIVNVYQLNAQLFTLAKTYYQQPQNAMTIVGITGTNGKTTTSQLLAQMLNAKKSSCAIIGTNGAGAVNNLTPIENTTPSACELHQLFNQFRAQYFSHVAMEVSSHALSQKRVLADLFDIALFTNLSRDHLDYHGSMEEYGAAKKQIFTGDDSQVALINADDEQGKSWIENWSTLQPLWVYSRQTDVKIISEYRYYVSAQHIVHHSNGVSFTLVSHLGSIDIVSSLLGDFNIDNLLAAMSVLLIQGVALSELPQLVRQVTAISGRMETTTADNLATAVVDYAHTPDALEKALQACRQHCDGTLYVVFGCGGDRDKGKRPLMAQAAEKYADVLVLTNDNPRTEDAQTIANDILAGFENPNAKNISVILERKDAVLATLAKANSGDIVLLAGKGHEDYIILPEYNKQGAVIGTNKVAYNERQIVAEFYAQHSPLAEKTAGIQL